MWEFFVHFTGINQIQVYSKHIRWFQEALWCPSSSLSSVNFYIPIFSSETVGQIGTKHGRNAHWAVLYKMYVFFPDGKSITETSSHKTLERVFVLVEHLFFNNFFYNATFSNISAKSWRPVLVVEEAKDPKKLSVQ
jgi:hypothetical protein